MGEWTKLADGHIAFGREHWRCVCATVVWFLWFGFLLSRMPRRGLDVYVHAVTRANMRGICGIRGLESAQTYRFILVVFVCMWVSC